MIDSNKTNVNQIATIANKQSSRLSRKRLFKLSIMTTQVLLLFASLLTTVLPGVTGVYIRKYSISAKELEMKQKQYRRLTYDLTICEQQKSK
jgi:hypothetical protein